MGPEVGILSFSLRCVLKLVMHLFWQKIHLFPKLEEIRPIRIQ